jgi:hypothetical protein
VFVAAFGGAHGARAESPETPVLRETRGHGGEATVSLGVVGARVATRSELAAFVGVTVPFERFALPRAARVAADGVVPAAERDLADEDEASEADAMPPEEAAGDVVPALSAELFAELARQVVAAAQNAHGAAEHASALDGTATRARFSALLPEVRVRAARSRDDSLKLQPTIDDPYRYSTVGGDGLWLEAQATFRLNRLVFADEEVQIERLRIMRERVAEERAERVLSRLARWHRALSRERSLLDEAARGRAALERIALEAELDVLTEGWFGERVKRLGLRTPPPPGRASEPEKRRAPAPAPKTSERLVGPAVAHLEASVPSATSAVPCLPKLATESKTFRGALMR